MSVLKILLVDSNAEQRDALAGIIRKHFPVVAVVGARSSTEALQTFNVHDIQCTVVRSGVEEMKRCMRAKDQSGRLTSSRYPLLFAIHESEESQLDQDEVAEAEFDYLTTPYEEEKVVSVLQPYIRSIERRKDAESNLPELNARLRNDINERKSAEDSLRKGWEQYRYFVMNHPDVVYQANREGLITFIHGEIENLTGYNGREFTRTLREWDVIVYTPDVDGRRAALKPGGDEDEIELTYRIVHKNGSFRWVKETIRHVTDENGDPLYIQGLIRDLSDEKRREQRLLEEIQRQRVITDNMMDLLSQTDLKGNFLYVSPSHRRVLGYSAEELDGKCINDFLPEEDIAKLWSAVRITFNIFIPHVNEFRFLHAKGHYVWLEIGGNFIFDEDGTPVGVVFSSRDITLRKRSEEELRQREEQLRTFVQNAPVILFSTDRDGTLTMLEGRVKETFGVTADALAGRSIYDVFGKENDMTQQVEQVLDGHVGSWQVTLERRFLEMIATPLTEKSGEVTGLVGVANDVTESRRIDRMKSEFVAVVSHELRTPLTSILGSIDLIRNGFAGNLSQEMQQLIELAGNNSNRLLRLVNDVIDIEKFESGLMVFNCTSHAIMPLVEKSLEDCKSIGEQFGVIFVLVGSAPDTFVHIDAERLKQVMGNLLSNAAKFSPPDTPVVVSVQRFDHSARINITDSGPGIPDDFRNRIFQKFSQADSSDTRKADGTGLGLSISKAIIEKMGGEIGYEANYEKGTTFYLDLPLAEVPVNGQVPVNGELTK